jgi:7-cyano-7-deazaguanine synthase
MMKCVVILSGGCDSTTVAYWAKSEGYEVHAITFDYGQIAKNEIKQASEIAEELGITHKTIDLSGVKEVYAGVTSLVDEEIPMTAEFSEPIIVPFRNGVFLAVAAAHAASIGAQKIFYGAQGSDEANYPDCRTEFYEAFEKAVRLGTEKPISIEAPFSGSTKSQTLLKGLELRVPYHLTWSCYKNEARHCGRCESCMNRKKAFREAGVPDPTEYEP